MENYLSTEKLGKLTPTQKEALRTLWKPVKYELFAVEVCMDAENDIYDYNIFVIKEVIFNSFNEDKKGTFSPRMIDSYNYHQILLDAIPLHLCELSEENEDIIEEIADEVEVPEENLETEYIINIEDSLPLLNVSVMSEMIFKKRCRVELNLKKEMDIYSCCLDNETVYEGESEIDVLWKALIEIL